jgi:two-component system phosphate regulon response regulator PhoB
MTESRLLAKYASPTANKRTILVIDDEESFCDVVCEILDSLGYKTRQAYDAHQANALLQEITPDLILTDVMMPELDGLTFLRQLRSDPTWSKTPIIIVSAKATKDDREAAMEAGADGYLIKPFSSLELEELITHTLSSHA